MEEEDVQGRTVYIGNVPYYVNEAGVREFLGDCGELASLRSGGKPNHKTRYWFVEFINHSDASAACRLNGSLLGDRSVRVSLSHTPKFTATVKNGPSLASAPMSDTPQPVVPQQQLHTGFPQPPPNMPSFSGQSFPLLPIRSQLQTGPLRTRVEKVSRTVYVEGVENVFYEDDIAHYFAICGTVVAVRVSDTCASSRRAWVEFETRDQANSALELSGQRFGRGTIQVRFSRTAICTNGLARPVSYKNHSNRRNHPTHHQQYQDLHPALPYNTTRHSASFMRQEHASNSARTMGGHHSLGRGGGSRSDRGNYGLLDRPAERSSDRDSGNTRSCHQSEGNLSDRWKWMATRYRSPDGKRAKSPEALDGDNSSRDKRARRESWWEKEGKFKK